MASHYLLRPDNVARPARSKRLRRSDSFTVTKRKEVLSQMTPFEAVCKALGELGPDPFSARDLVRPKAAQRGHGVGHGTVQESAQGGRVCASNDQ